MIVLTAATPWEAKPLIDLWNMRGNGAPIYEGLLGKQAVRLIKTGIGREKTAKALEPLNTQDSKTPLWVISYGLAGALQEEVRSGDLVADIYGVPEHAAESARRTAQNMGLRLHLGKLHTSDTLVTEPGHKRELGRKLRAAAVDMESSAVRRWCESRNGTFIGIRGILDEVHERLPDGLCDEDSIANLSRFALRHWKELPLLARLGLRQRRVMKSLSCFLDVWLKNIQQDMA